MIPNEVLDELEANPEMWLESPIALTDLMRTHLRSLVADARKVSRFEKENAALVDQCLKLEQLVCDFQAAAMIDVGDGGPCRVEPHHITKHVEELRDKLTRAEKRIEELQKLHFG